mmetsp:Transcript_18606/g.74290  ORF Transcript_18606/g.74290 Transcript_18606/m.74290 type:complete len:205 (-) Transcript_18606:1300-1914(-)
MWALSKVGRTAPSWWRSIPRQRNPPVYCMTTTEDSIPFVVVVVETETPRHSVLRGGRADGPSCGHVDYVAAAVPRIVEAGLSPRQTVVGESPSSGPPAVLEDASGLLPAPRWTRARISARISGGRSARIATALPVVVDAVVGDPSPWTSRCGPPLWWCAAKPNDDTPRKNPVSSKACASASSAFSGVSSRWDDDVGTGRTSSAW